MQVLCHNAKTMATGRVPSFSPHNPRNRKKSCFFTRQRRKQEASGTGNSPQRGTGPCPGSLFSQEKSPAPQTKRETDTATRVTVSHRQPGQDVTANLFSSRVSALQRKVFAQVNSARLSVIHDFSGRSGQNNCTVVHKISTITNIKRFTHVVI